MTRAATALLWAVLLSVTTLAAEKPRPFFPYPVRSTRLANGLTVVRIPFKSPGLVALYTAVRVGSRNEIEPGHTGFAHFFEHVMFKGTARHPEGSREKALAEMGFSDNAFTTDDHTVYHSYGPSAGLEQLIELEADRFQNLEFSEQTFQTEAKAVLGEYHKSAMSPDLKLEEAVLKTAFTRHTYQHTTLGFYEDIQKMPAEYAYSREFFKRWYTPDNTFLVVAGDFDDGKLLAWVTRAYGSWKGRAASSRVPAEPPQTQERVTRVEWASAALPRLVWAWHTPAATLAQKDGAVQAVLATYLTGPTSALHKELVLEKQWAEEVGSWSYEHRDPALLTLIATLKDERFRKDVEAAFGKAVGHLINGKVDKAQLAALKQNLRYGFLMRLETANAVAGQVAWYAAIFGVPDGLEQHFQNIDRVQAEDLVRFARKHFQISNRTVVDFVVKPPSKGEAAGGAP